MSGVPAPESAAAEAQGGIVWCGSGAVDAAAIEHLLANGIRIDCFVSLTPEQGARFRVAGYADYAPLAARLGIPVYRPFSYNLRDERDVAWFAARRFDILLVGTWQRLIPAEVLETLRIGGVGGHGSAEFLPRGRGRSPVNWSIIEGRRRFVLHLFLMKPGADDGDVIAYEMFDVNEWDTCQTVYYKVSILMKRMLVKYIPLLLRGEVTPVPQAGEPSYYPRRTPEDGEIDWTADVFRIHDLVRALTHPYPGAFSYAAGERVFFWKAQPFDTRLSYYPAAAGEVVEVFPTGDFVVNCTTGLLLVTEATARPAVGTRFGRLDGPGGA